MISILIKIIVIIILATIVQPYVELQDPLTCCYHPVNNKPKTRLLVLWVCPWFYGCVPGFMCLPLSLCLYHWFYGCTPGFVCTPGFMGVYPWFYGCVFLV